MQHRQRRRLTLARCREPERLPARSQSIRLEGSVSTFPENVAQRRRENR